ncbi:MAG: hypothetical protein C5B50_21580 [Verrucomicrobia bacterium]|nr:MAG: hypothetical protein C5B50_21580 [Verrucomicrobiota bacterium]
MTIITVTCPNCRHSREFKIGPGLPPEIAASLERIARTLACSNCQKRRVARHMLPPRVTWAAMSCPKD